ncbi:MAG: hypothetical protein M3217_00095, partial [Actinomycetota bacterium]|nr:hypothetical protein [Actinomycetota bacterium]
MTARPSRTIRSLYVAAGAGLLGMISMYWDMAHHIDIGTDTFFSSPHLGIYGSAGLTFGAVV